MNNEEQHGENSPKGKRARTKSHSEPKTIILCKEIKRGTKAYPIHRETRLLGNIFKETVKHLLSTPLALALATMVARKNGPHLSQHLLFLIDIKVVGIKIIIFFFISFHYEFH